MSGDFWAGLMIIPVLIAAFGVALLILSAGYRAWSTLDLRLVRVVQRPKVKLKPGELSPAALTVARSIDTGEKIRMFAGLGRYVIIGRETREATEEGTTR